MKLTDLFEADSKKSKTKTQSKFNTFNFDPQKDQPLSKKSADTAKDLSSPVSKSKTDSSMKNIRMSQKSADHLKDLAKNIPDDGSDDEVKPKPPSTDLAKITTSNLPKHISAELSAAGQVHPEWHAVANLPGNVASMIRKLGKQLFGAFTSTPTDKIIMVGDLGAGPNTSKEVNAVAAYLKKEGKSLGPGSIDFSTVMPGYKADIHLFVAMGAQFMVVKDHAGQYVYAWPAADSKDPRAQASIENDLKKLN